MTSPVSSDTGSFLRPTSPWPALWALVIGFILLGVVAVLFLRRPASVAR